LLTEDHRLVEKACAGETAAFRELVERYQKQVYFLARDMTGNHQDAEDLSQDVFIKAYRSLDGFRGDAKFSSWLYRITVNTCIDKSRKKTLKSMQLEENMDDMHITAHHTTGQRSPDPEKMTEASLMRLHIEKALKKLTDKERTVFVLRHYRDLKLNEIAEILEINTGTVKSTLFRAIQKLQKLLSFYKEEMCTEAPRG
jgi:RNA polymerase sigma-70 factor (ECF subfamily)